MKTNKYFDMKTISNMLRSEYEVFIGRRHSGKTPVIAQRIYELEDHINILQMAFNELIEDLYYPATDKYKERIKEEYITKAYRKYYETEEEDGNKETDSKN